jgi:hypothetical protein
MVNMALSNGKSFVMMSGSTEPKGQRDEWFSPKWIFDALGLEFDIDVCAPLNGVSWIPAKKHFSIEDDGLSQEWMGKRVWMNPPYSKPLPWTTKFRDNANGIALLPTTIGKWWLELYEDKRTSWLALPPMRFIDPQGNTATNTMPSRAWLVAIGETNITALKASGLGKLR